MKKKIKKPRLFSALEVADICGVVNQTAINWIKKDHLKAFSTPGGQYRVYADDLAVFLQEQGMRIPEDLSEEIRREGKYNILILDQRAAIGETLSEAIESYWPRYEIRLAYSGFEAGLLMADELPSHFILGCDNQTFRAEAIIDRIKGDQVMTDVQVIAYSLDADSDLGKIEKKADLFFSGLPDPEALYGKVKEYYAATQG